MGEREEKEGGRRVMQAAQRGRERKGGGARAPAAAAEPADAAA